MPSRLKQKWNANSEMRIISIFAEIGSVVQLDRMADSGSVGWGFESLRSHTQKKSPETVQGFFI